MADIYSDSYTGALAVATATAVVNALDPANVETTTAQATVVATAPAPTSYAVATASVVANSPAAFGDLMWDGSIFRPNRISIWNGTTWVSG